MNGNKLRFLQRWFPVIKRAQFKNKSIYFLEDKNKFTLQEMMKQNSSRIISYQDLSKRSLVFNTDVEIQQKRAFLGKNRHKKIRKIKESVCRCDSIPKEKHPQLDNFLGRFLHSEVME